jgi:hypothetical protein
LRKGGLFSRLLLPISVEGLRHFQGPLRFAARCLAAA